MAISATRIKVAELAEPNDPLSSSDASTAINIEDTPPPQTPQVACQRAPLPAPSERVHEGTPAPPCEGVVDGQHRTPQSLEVDHQREQSPRDHGTLAQSHQGTAGPGKRLVRAPQLPTPMSDQPQSEGRCLSIAAHLITAISVSINASHKSIYFADPSSQTSNSCGVYGRRVSGTAAGGNEKATQQGIQGSGERVRDTESSQQTCEDAR